MKCESFFFVATALGMIMFIICNASLPTNNPVYHWLYFLISFWSNGTALGIIVSISKTFFEWPRTTLVYIAKGRPSSSSTGTGSVLNKSTKSK